MATYQVLGINQGLGYGDTLNVVTSTFDDVANPVATTDIIFAWNTTNVTVNSGITLLQLREAMRTFEYFLLQSGNIVDYPTENVI